MIFPRIKTLRRESNLTQSDMAKILQISKSSYGRYEKGERELPYDVGLGIADYYNISLDYILGRSDRR